jgi:hypothetical protein
LFDLAFARGNFSANTDDYVSTVKLPAKLLCNCLSLYNAFGGGLELSGPNLGIGVNPIAD